MLNANFNYHFKAMSHHVFFCFSFVFLPFFICFSLSPTIGWLILTDNKIESLPESIGQLHLLQKCMLAGNQLSTLPSNMKNCQKLELLRVASNNFDAIPHWLFELPRLAWLACGGNPCTPNRVAPHVATIAFASLTLKNVLGIATYR
eukprot:m.72481 g.72481  ORF g.72481 m.72481 type:complete len:147 (-) comp24456_c0_seq3:159-599(-)